MKFSVIQNFVRIHSLQPAPALDLSDRSTRIDDIAKMIEQRGIEMSPMWRVFQIRDVLPIVVVALIRV